jgi:hypothetical protein
MGNRLLMCSVGGNQKNLRTGWTGKLSHVCSYHGLVKALGGFSRSRDGWPFPHGHRAHEEAFYSSSILRSNDLAPPAACTAARERTGRK